MPNDTLATSPRRSERVLLRIPIRVEGTDALGNAFEETTYTLVVNRSGGLIAVSRPLERDAVIKITNLSSHTSCPFQVVTRAAQSLSGIPEWGVKSLEPEVEIWGVHFPIKAEEPSPADLIHVLLECQQCYSREMAALTVQQYRRLAEQSSLPRPCPKCTATRDWKFGFIEVQLEEAFPSVPEPTAPGLTPQGGIERRRDKRLVVKLPLGLRLPDGSEESSTTENISRSGVCFACNLEMQVGDRVYVNVKSDGFGEERDIPARVMWRRPTKEEEGRALYGVKFERGA
jgi:hypothetical protein